jgi:hypothetical protein
MKKRADANEVAILRDETNRFEVIEVSEKTYRWAQRDCALGSERRRIRRPFAATIVKTPNLCGPVLRLASE